jgi:hypothetical protein
MRSVLRRAVMMVALLAGLAALAAAQEAPASPTPPPPATQAPATPNVVYKPKFPGDPARSEPEAAALGYMRTVLNAQRDYKKKFNHYASSLYALAGGARSFTKRMARTDRGDYTVAFRGGSEHFSVALTPKQYDAAHRAFFMDDRGIFHVEDDKPAAADSPLLKESFQ